MELEKTNAIITLLNNHKVALNKVLWALDNYAEKHPSFGWFAVNGYRSFLPPEKEALKANLITENDVRVELLMCAKDVADVKNVAQLFKQLVKPLELKKMLPVWEGIMDRLLVCKDKQMQYAGCEMKEWSYINIDDFYMVISNLQQWEKSLNNIYKQLGGIDIWEEEGNSCKTYGIKTEEKLPDALKTPKAKDVFEKLVEAGYLVDGWMCTDKLGSRRLKVVAISYMAKALDIKNKWCVFEPLWGVSKLAQDKWKITEFGYTDDEDVVVQELAEIFGFYLNYQSL